jgi:hypothetical protein
MILSNPAIIYTNNREYLCELTISIPDPTNTKSFLKARDFRYFPPQSTDHSRQSLSKTSQKRIITSNTVDRTILYCHRWHSGLLWLE